MNRSAILFGLVGPTLAVGLLAAPASAEDQVQLKGKHTKAEINAACDAVGGIQVEGSAGSKGYGCYNRNNGVLVACTDGGECTGFIPPQPGRRQQPSADLTVLGVGKPTLDATPFEPKTQPPVRGPATRRTTPASPG